VDPDYIVPVHGEHRHLRRWCEIADQMEYECILLDIGDELKLTPEWAEVVGKVPSGAVIVDGAPQWGSDVGGVLALVPAFTLLVLLLGGRTASLGRLALAGLVGAAVVAAFGIADHARPADQQTHLGRFVGARGCIRAIGGKPRRTRTSLAPQWPVRSSVGSRRSRGRHDRNSGVPRCRYGRRQPHSAGSR